MIRLIFRNEVGICLAWAIEGSLIVSTNQSIRNYGKWFSLHQENGTKQNIFKRASRINGRLPDHHPQLLINYLLLEKVDIVRTILSLLYYMTKTSSESGIPMQSNIPVSISQIITETLPLTCNEKNDYTLLFGDDNTEYHIYIYIYFHL